MGTEHLDVREFGVFILIVLLQSLGYQIESHNKQHINGERNKQDPLIDIETIPSLSDQPRPFIGSAVIFHRIEGSSRSSDEEVEDGQLSEQG